MSDIGTDTTPSMDEMRSGRRRIPIAERLLAKINKTESCWLWTGSKNNQGYGQIGGYTKTGKATNLLAHRVSYECFKGPIPRGLSIDHLCRVPLCVNPDHLEAVTLKENIFRGTSHIPLNKNKTHCVHGHPFDAENTRIRDDGQRECIECVRRRTQELIARRRIARERNADDAAMRERCRLREAVIELINSMTRMLQVNNIARTDGVSVADVKAVNVACDAAMKNGRAALRTEDDHG